MEKIGIIISVIIASAVVVFALLNIMPRVDRYLNIRAIEACGGISQFVKENSDQAFKAQYPVADVYKNCIEQAK